MKKNGRNPYFAAGALCFAAVLADRQFGILPLLAGAEWGAFLAGALTGLCLVLLGIGVYNGTHDVPFAQRKQAWLSGAGQSGPDQKR